MSGPLFKDGLPAFFDGEPVAGGVGDCPPICCEDGYIDIVGADNHQRNRSFVDRKINIWEGDPAFSADGQHVSPTINCNVLAIHYDDQTKELVGWLRNVETGVDERELWRAPAGNLQRFFDDPLSYVGEFPELEATGPGFFPDEVNAYRPGMIDTFGVYTVGGRARFVLQARARSLWSCYSGGLNFPTPGPMQVRSAATGSILSENVISHLTTIEDNGCGISTPHVAPYETSCIAAVADDEVIITYTHASPIPQPRGWVPVSEFTYRAVGPVDPLGIMLDSGRNGSCDQFDESDGKLLFWRFDPHSFVGQRHMMIAGEAGVYCHGTEYIPTPDGVIKIQHLTRRQNFGGCAPVVEDTTAFPPNLAHRCGRIYGLSGGGFHRYREADGEQFSTGIVGGTNGIGYVVRDTFPGGEDVGGDGEPTEACRLSCGPNAGVDGGGHQPCCNIPFEMLRAFIDINARCSEIGVFDVHERLIFPCRDLGFGDGNCVAIFAETIYRPPCPGDCFVDLSYSLTNDGFSPVPAVCAYQVQDHECNKFSIFLAFPNPGQNDGQGGVEYPFLRCLRLGLRARTDQGCVYTAQFMLDPRGDEAEDVCFQ